MSINTITLSGTIGQNPELKVAKSGKRFTSFTIANNTGYGENKKTNWFKIMAFNSTAEYIQRYGKKGDFVIVSGRLDKNEWTDRDNIVHKDYTVLANEVEIKSKDTKTTRQQPLIQNPFAPQTDDKVGNAMWEAGFNEYYGNQDDLPF